MITSDCMRYIKLHCIKLYKYIELLKILTILYCFCEIKSDYI